MTVAKPLGSKLGVTVLPLSREHVTEIYVGWLNDPDVTQFTEVCSPQTIDSVSLYVDENSAAVDATAWRIIKGEEHVGNIRLSRINRTHRRAEIAILIGAKHRWGEGIGPAAIDLVSSFAFLDLGLRKLVAGILSPNIGSIRAFEKAHYNIEAVQHRHAQCGEEICDNVLLARFADETSE